MSKEVDRKTVINPTNHTGSFLIFRMPRSGEINFTDHNRYLVFGFSEKPWLSQTANVVYNALWD